MLNTDANYCSIYMYIYIYMYGDILSYFMCTTMLCLYFVFLSYVSSYLADVSILMCVAESSIADALLRLCSWVYVGTFMPSTLLGKL